MRYILGMKALHKSQFYSLWTVSVKIIKGATLKADIQLYHFRQDTDKSFNWL